MDLKSLQTLIKERHMACSKHQKQVSRVSKTKAYPDTKKHGWVTYEPNNAMKLLQLFKIPELFMILTGDQAKH